MLLTILFFRDNNWSSNYVHFENIIYKISVLDSQGWLDYKATNDIDKMYLYVIEVIKESNYYGVMVKEYDESKKSEKIILLRTLSKSKSLVLRKEK